jgi:hypothetical protein
MKKVLVFLLILAFACPVLAEHYGSSYYQKNKRFALQGKGTPDPVYAALKELEGSGTANDSSKGFSPAIWDTCPALQFMLDPQAGFIYFTDFKEGLQLPANCTTAAADANFHMPDYITACTAATAGTVISTLATDINGVVRLKSVTDNEDAIVCVLGGKNAAGMVSFRSGKALWMEARIKVGLISDSNYSVYVGFAQEGLTATTTLITASDALVDKDYVGFRRTFADGDKLDTVINTESAEGPNDIGADAITIVADTWVKVGMYFDGTTLTFYKNGVALADTIALDSAIFTIDEEELAFYVGLMINTSAGGNRYVDIDWVRIATEW